jgi:hypothetical protein
MLSELVIGFFLCKEKKNIKRSGPTSLLVAG